MEEFLLSSFSGETSGSMSMTNEEIKGKVRNRKRATVLASSLLTANERKAHFSNS